MSADAPRTGAGEAELGGEALGPAHFADEALTDDAFLGGRVKLLQPKEGYRAATDPVLLAAACRAAPGERVLDVGCGAGAAAICLGARTPGLSLEGIERAPALAALADRNGRRNGAPIMARAGDLRRPPLFFRSAEYDHILTNPPFYPAGSAPPAGTALRDAAHRETASLAEWLDFCLRRLRPGGGLTVIHRAERLPEILALLSGRAGAVEAIPLWPRAGVAAKRVIVRGVKEAKGPFRLAPGLTVHPPEGEGFTAEAEAILRDGAPLDM